MNTARHDDSCPFEWAEFNLPEELRSATKSISPFARLVLDVSKSVDSTNTAWPFDGRARSQSRLGSLLLPGLGFPLPKL
jgi:hypothetical protein